MGDISGDFDKGAGAGEFGAGGFGIGEQVLSGKPFIFTNKNKRILLTLDIKENRVPFFLELIQNFDFINVTKQEDELSDVSIPEWHQQEVRKRLADLKKTY